MALNDDDFLKTARNMFTIVHHSRLPSHLFINGHRQQQEGEAEEEGEEVGEISFISLHIEKQSADGKKTKSQRRVFSCFVLLRAGYSQALGACFQLKRASQYGAADK